MLRFIDSLFDRAAKRLAENMCSNMEEVQRNRAIREESERLHTSLPLRKQSDHHVASTDQNTLFIA
jgi:hypothetical protein